MAWETELVMIVRGLIGDFDDTNYTYSNTRLKELILVAAQTLQGTLDFSTTYTVDTDEVVLSPDPTTGTKDNAFINLSCLKCASIILSSEWRTASTNAYSFKDGPSSLDAKSVASEKQALAKEAAQNLEEAILQYRAGSSSPGAAIIGPYAYGVDYQDGAFERLPVSRRYSH